MAEMVAFGPHRMGLSLELIRVLTGGDTVGLAELLRREEQTNGQVAITVQAAVAPGAVPPPPPTPPPPAERTSCLLGVTSNGNTALHLAASRGHAELAALICDRAPPLVATRNKCLDTPLHCAAKAGSRDVAARILATMRTTGADGEMALRARNQTGATALYEAVRHGHAEVVDLLMEKAPELAALATDGGFSPLYSAAAIDSLEMVQSLLRPSQDGTPSPASFSGPEGRTALHVAAVSFDEEIPREILKWEPVGPSLLTEVDSSGRTPLQYAVLYERLDVVELFLDGHTSEQARIPDDHGLFPVHTAAMVGSKRIIDELIKKCPDYYELVDDRGRNLLHCAVEHNKETVVRHICQDEKFAMLLNATDADGNTALHLAAKHVFPRIFNLLLQVMTVKIGITNKDGLTAADLGRRARHPGRSYYFLDSRAVLSNCLWWSGATKTITLDGVHPYVGMKLADLFQKQIQATEDEPSNDNEDAKTGTIGSVLIATVAFTAAFTVPGGFIADDHPDVAGTAILAKKFAFRAFVVSDTMAFATSILATCFLIYGASEMIPRRQRSRYSTVASGLVPVAAQSLIAAFAFAFHLVLGHVNRGLIVFVYTVSLATVLFCFPGIWGPLQLGLAKAVWRRAGWRGLLNLHNRPSRLVNQIWYFSRSLLFNSYIRRPLLVYLISASFIVAIALDIALPNY